MLRGQLVSTPEGRTRQETDETVEVEYDEGGEKNERRVLFLYSVHEGTESRNRVRQEHVLCETGFGKKTE